MVQGSSPGPIIGYRWTVSPMFDCFIRSGIHIRVVDGVRTSPATSAITAMAARRTYIFSEFSLRARPPTIKCYLKGDYG